MTRDFNDQQLDAIATGLKAGEPIEKVLASIPPGKAKKARNNEESRAQRLFFKWWNLAHYAEFKLPKNVMHSVPNGGFRSIVTASIMKAEGQSRGTFDIKLNVARSIFHGLWLELKAEKGVLSDDQIAFRKSMDEQNYYTAIAYNFDQAKKIVTDYLHD